MTFASGEFEKPKVRVILAYGERDEYDLHGVPVVASPVIRKDIEKTIQPEFVITHEQDARHFEFLPGLLNFEVVGFKGEVSSVSSSAISYTPRASLWEAHLQMQEAINKGGYVDTGIFIVANPNLLTELKAMFQIQEVYFYRYLSNDRRGTPFAKHFLDWLSIGEQIDRRELRTNDGVCVVVWRYKQLDFAEQVEAELSATQEPSKEAPLSIRGVFLIENGLDTRLNLSKVVAWTPSRNTPVFTVGTVDGADFACRYTTMAERDEGLRRFDQAMSEFLTKE